ncbi:carbohydrate esterase family 1 protein [Periconia macrospinosa]|uniref:Carboxylic ester hydrolase n=1 Tax=Periconia macrospinosa TaxID=97972 RepID=A0A2V1EGN3_9PLEO|nr:carbohydrate esterase family 1 protein [Periconia macrospinosa]
MIFSKLLALAASATTVMGASLQRVTSFGSNPTNIQFYIYVPDKLATNPAIIVGLHPCGGNAQQWFSGTRLPSYADKNGFILIYPGTPNYSNCWDVQNAASLTHGAGGDALGVISMVNYTLDKYKADKSKVYVMGSSSGAMMTNLLAGSYPDVFEAGSAYSGVAHACFAGSTQPPTPFSSNQTCAQGLQHSAAEWGNFVRNSYPGYTGRRPRMQIWHGNADTLVRPQCATEALKQWSNVLNVTLSKSNAGVPSAAYTQQVYGDGTQLVGYFGQGVGHTAPVNEDYMLRFFGLIA